MAVHRAGTHRASAVLSPSAGSDKRERGGSAAVESVSSSPLDCRLSGVVWLQGEGRWGVRISRSLSPRWPGPMKQACILKGGC